MAYRYSNRYQLALLPQSIEEYVAKDDPVRAYDAFVEAIDFNELVPRLISFVPDNGKIKS